MAFFLSGTQVHACPCTSGVSCGFRRTSPRFWRLSTLILLFSFVLIFTSLRLSKDRGSRSNVGGGAMISIRNVSKSFGRVKAVQRCFAGHPGGRVLFAAWGVRLGQDDASAHDCGFEAVTSGTIADRRARDAGRATAPAPDQHGVPELRDLPASERARQHRLRTEAAGNSQGTGSDADGGRDAGDDRPARLWRAQGAASCRAGRCSAWRWRAR